MNPLLDKTFTVRELLRVLATVAILLAAIYGFRLFQLVWLNQYGGVGYRNSPYAVMVPAECHKSAADAGQLSIHFSTQAGVPEHLRRSLFLDALLLRPTGDIYSLPAAEKKLGPGMRGLPCMGYDFLVRLHGGSFARKDRYVDEHGKLIATVTTEVYRPYREPLPQGKWIDPWDDITNPPANDASLPTMKN